MTSNPIRRSGPWGDRTGALTDSTPIVWVTVYLVTGSVAAAPVDVVGLPIMALLIWLTPVFGHPEWLFPGLCLLCVVPWLRWGYARVRCTSPTALE